MEKININGEDLEIFENDIDQYISEFCQKRNIEDLNAESQSVWNAALMYVRKKAFPDKSILKISKPLEGYKSNDYDNKFNNLNNSNCNAYDINIINYICDYYIYLCCMYDKEISITGFSYLTGIDDNTLYDWGNDVRKLSSSGAEIYKKLHKGREESLSNKLVTGKQNPVGILGVLNRHYQWNMPGVKDQAGTRAVLTASELPKFGQVVQIEQKTDIEQE